MPFLKIGPFRLEVKLYIPFRTVIHDFFSKKEMDWMMDYSRPSLTAARVIPPSTSSISKAELRNANDKTGYTVGKAITTWFNDIIYTEKQQYAKTMSNGRIIEVEHPPLNEPNSYHIELTAMSQISKRIQLSTGLNVTSRHGASEYQVTNYGLSGMVIPHLDPWGYESGVELPEDRIELSRTGDYIATFMGWLKQPEAGGGTCFTETDYEVLIEPTEGSAAFWLDLSASHELEQRSKHGGCPVLKGQKWIINKWIYSWDQWRRLPCLLNSNATIPPFLGMTAMF